jgi:hypothetical protein
MSHEGVNGVLRVLLQLLTHSEWEARHGGLLGLKYLLAVKEVRVSLLLLVTSEILLLKIQWENSTVPISEYF